jgi:hypothetical protein
MNALTKSTIPVIFIAFIFIAVGCAGRPIQVGVVDQQMDTADIDFTRGREISVSASGFQLLLFIPIRVNSRHERAYQVLRSRAGNDYIANIQIQEVWKYAFVGTIYRTTIKAMAYPRKPSSN